jgi:DNA polymerase III subunit beta
LVIQKNYNNLFYQMKFTCSQSDLNANLSLVSRAVPSRPTHPILGNILLVADANTQTVSLTGFDLSLGIRTTMGAQIEEAGDLTLPAKLLGDIVSRLPQGEITIVTADDEAVEGGDGGNRPRGEENLTTIQSASGSFQIRAMAATEYPELPTIEAGQTLSLPVSVFGEGLKGALFAASTDETKQILTGVHIRTMASKGAPIESLEFAATDGHRLAVVQTTLESSANEAGEGEIADARALSQAGDLANFALTVPARALRELEKMLAVKEDGDTVSLHFDESQIIFDLGDRRLTSRKLEGSYPAYEQLIPSKFSRTLTVDRKRLIGGLELVSVLADQRNNLVKFILDSDRGQLSLAVDAKDVGNAREAMPAEITGESTDIAFNVKYLMDGLKALAVKEIKMELNESDRPVIFTPLGGLKMTYLVMPVQIRE